ncbi:glycine--tRNA ligase subunit beta [Sphingomonas sp.]|jgi:glycyl-tRNA synthetase beta chain|uniref:glycine--tRNA ligase subunit beta n=1 Tax=Sphingomonas sp. TaxID=28214 RepID=UPI002D7E2CD4|nr:glycine--tRNA ligase subunit beta [Sphingomonas sp.]HEU0044050.1 glycine--tRNA ligase subunit beta [Sphingomonas sp.]
MTDFLLELRSEEIPARMQAKARDDLARLFAAELAKAGLTATETVTYATPRRLALIARGLPDSTAAVSEEVKGPRSSAPPQALEGFLRKTGLTREDLTERDGVFFAVTQKPGRATAEVLAEAIPAVIRAFPWPKSMRWGDASASTDSLRWVRPLQGIVALFGEDVVPVEIAGVVSGAATLGHRFHHPGPITIGSAADYVEKLRLCHVIVDQDERAALIRDRAHALAAEAGLALVADEGLVAENAGLTEWPVPLLGRFDEAFLSVPPEVIQLTARVNQKYFVLSPLPGREGPGVGPETHDGAAKDLPTPSPSLPGRGGLASAFLCTANIDAADGGVRIVEGNRKVLAARLSDARFFYEQDLKVPLEEQAKKLDRIVFHEKLGTVADKVERVAKLARWLVEEGIISSPQSGEGDHAQHGGGVVPHRSPFAAPPSHHSATPSGPPPLTGEDLAALAERAARLCKADLVTGMVAEFPELQGVMGGYYAQAQGEDPRVADAIRDHYKPVGQGDDVPTAPVTVAVSLADKLDTLSAFFWISEKPTGSRDPFALRRAALGCAAILVDNGIRLALEQIAALAIGSLEANPRLRVTGEIGDAESVAEHLIEFMAERIRVQRKEAGLRHDLWNAVYTLGADYKPVDDDLVRLLARVRALQAFVGTEDGANLLTGYRRAANILKKEGYDSPTPNRHPGLEPGSPFSSPQEGSGTPGQARGDEQLSSPQIPLSYTPEPPEKALHAALDSAEPAAADAVREEDFGAAMAALASLRAPIDQFFEAVTVNDPAPEKRASRLRLLARVRDAVHTVADFSKIEG